MMSEFMSTIMTQKQEEIECRRENNVPQIAVLLSGGGLTASLGTLGSLWELKNQNLLDAVTYLPGCSGSIWCMASLYEKGDWTQNLDSIATEMCDKLASLSFDAKKGLEKLLEAAEQDNYSLTHFWAYGIVNYTTKEIIENGISSHRALCESGSVPYPIYSAADKQQLNIKGRNNAGTWFQFTPHEAGYPLLGAFVSSELFDSKFNNNKLQKKKPEKDLCYLEAICSSALADPEQATKLIIEKVFELVVTPYLTPLNLITGLSSAVPVLENHTEVFSSISNMQKIINESADDSKAVLENLLTSLSVVRDKASCQLVKLMNDRWVANGEEEKTNLASILNLLLHVEMKELVRTWSFLKSLTCEQKDFCKSIPSDIIDKEVRYLVDAGLAINSPYPYILRKEQNVKVIISFEYFPLVDPFLGIKHAVDYCKAHNIPFPKVEIDPADWFNPKDCYIFEGENVPTVIHIPLFNRVTSEGEVQLRTAQYNIARLQYSKEEIDTLIDVTRKNVRNNIKKMKDAIQKKCNN
ncbi:cytosolic phospholipase A2 gamma-like [Rhinatrema bivittatum]|uniref:cytosolic phospholipase A2 gamma-like n=1 Tax=Rhinatrema bivittatum TaxID=194408 RepID=UPI00112B47A6|nr:cytosolic phospholipase A2 gamma-like [Rhinatrema bivittatum]